MSAAVAASTLGLSSALGESSFASESHPIPSSASAAPPTSRLFPPDILTFPREEWTSVVFAWPVFSPREDGLKVNYAARACSRRWMAALDDGDLGSLGVADFALAVFDKTDQMNSHLRRIRARLGRCYNDADTWLRLLEPVINFAHSLCYAVVSDAFPSSPKLVDFVDANVVVPFVRGAMGAVWQHGSDSYGERLPLHCTFDATWVDRYIPDPASLPPRPFTKANDDPDAPAEIIWLDYRGEVVPRPSNVGVCPLGRQSAVDSTGSATAWTRDSPDATNTSISSDSSPSLSPPLSPARATSQPPQTPVSASRTNYMSPLQRILQSPHHPPVVQ